MFSSFLRKRDFGIQSFCKACLRVGFRLSGGGVIIL